jgi:hypothetical protein
MYILPGRALAVTLLPISFVFSRALGMVLVVGVVGFYLRFLWAIQREVSRSHRRATENVPSRDCLRGPLRDGCTWRYRNARYMMSLTVKTALTLR